MTLILSAAGRKLRKTSCSWWALTQPTVTFEFKGYFVVKVLKGPTELNTDHYEWSIGPPRRKQQQRYGQHQRDLDSDGG